MSCPTCDHTMAQLTLNEGMNYTHCPRCGTVKVAILSSEQETIYTPKLVKRCRAYAGGLVRMPLQDRSAGEIFTGLQTAWHRLGIAESINVPERRP